MSAERVPAGGQGATIWLTGLPSAGKSTIARLLAPRLQASGHPVEILDGDEVRERLSKGLGFSREDRDENIRRIAYVARLLTRAGAMVIVAAVSPYRAARDEARAEIGRFLEVHVDCPVEECINRDVKGLYRRALNGEVPRFTGVSDPYEPPERPEVVVATRDQTPAQSTEAILNVMQLLGYLPAGMFGSFTPEEESRVVARLKSLGYLQ